MAWNPKTSSLNIKIKSFVVVVVVELWVTRRVIQAAGGICEADIHGRAKSTTSMLSGYLLHSSKN
jgi:hypothetical protein